MSDYLRNAAARVLGVIPVVQPRPASLYEPVQLEGLPQPEGIVPSGRVENSGAVDRIEVEDTPGDRTFTFSGPAGEHGTSRKSAERDGREKEAVSGWPAEVEARGKAEVLRTNPPPVEKGAAPEAAREQSVMEQSYEKTEPEGRGITVMSSKPGSRPAKKKSQTGNAPDETAVESGPAGEHAASRESAERKRRQSEAATPRSAEADTDLKKQRALAGSLWNNSSRSKRRSSVQPKAADLHNSSESTNQINVQQSLSQRTMTVSTSQPGPSGDISSAREGRREEDAGGHRGSRPSAQVVSERVDEVSQDPGRFHQRSIRPIATPLRQHSGNTSPSASPENIVNVMIGRIEIKASPPAGSPVARPANSKTVSLDEYLRKRNEELR